MKNSSDSKTTAGKNDDDVEASKLQQSSQDFPGHERAQAEGEDENLTPFAKRIAALPEKNWRLVQALGGTGLGLFCAFCIFVLGNTETFGSISLIIAAVAALFAPNYFEKTAGRKIPVLRKALLISLSACLAVAIILNFTGVV
ncbi:MAG: hypothetical protein BWY62_00863 [Firmicutes bacterium ADurb.Bin356]|nr:MAG: hypothetical protein BWY62_00863 [Firmicutes bacterium ADurb.Bin356]